MHQRSGQDLTVVVVTDGFTGNVALKTMEGTVGLARHYRTQRDANLE